MEFLSAVGDFLLAIPWWVWLIAVLVVLAIRDIFFNTYHTITHNFPLVGHIRYMLESIGPELRQYIVANNREELPFTRMQRSWVYASAKAQNNYQGFGTDDDLHKPTHIFISPAMFPKKLPEGHINHQDKAFLPCAKAWGQANGRKKPFRPFSAINISAMSFGSLSGRAIESLNKGALMAGAFHNTGEGSVSHYHSFGADLVFQLGTGYFGVRNDDGSFNMDKLVDLVETHPYIRAIEIKLSQGAKPGKGGVLPAKKITREIAEIRHIPMNEDVISPPYHSAFEGMEGLLEFIEQVAEKTGLPVGIKSAVGQIAPWREFAARIKELGHGPDFIAIDGGEGGTGAAPPSFSTHVSLPFVYAFTEVYKIFQEQGLTDRIAFGGAGKLGLPADTLMAFAMGCDFVYVAREPMMSIGCIQAQSCHNNTCPTGVATQNKWLEAGIKVNDKMHRCKNYINTLRKEVLEITHACGYEHPCQLLMNNVDVSMGDNNLTKPLDRVYEYEKSPVKFNGMAHLLACPHLGGPAKPESKIGLEKAGLDFYTQCLGL